MILDNFGSRVLGTKDYSRLYLWVPKLILTSTFLWPGDENYTIKKIYAIVSTTICIFMGIGLAIKIKVDLDDFSETTKNMVLTPAVSQPVFKILILVYHSKSIKVILNEMDNFWPHDLFGADDSISKFMRRLHKLLMTIMMVMNIIAVIYFTRASLIPMTVDKKILPFPVEYPFDQLASPTYELMYALHVVAFTFIVSPGVLGPDFLLLTICGSIVGQYIILQKNFAIFETEEMFEVNLKLRALCNDGLENMYDVRKEYLVRCIGHHQLLIRLLKRANSVFSLLELFQLISSGLAVCIGLLVTVQVKLTADQFLNSVTFIVGILLQLILYCAIGNELAYQSSLLPQYIFRSNWDTSTNIALKKDVMFILMASQKLQELTSYGLFKMDLVLLLQVVKFSFSIYTFLSKITNK